MLDTAALVVLPSTYVFTAPSVGTVVLEEFATVVTKLPIEFVPSFKLPKFTFP